MQPLESPGRVGSLYKCRPGKLFDMQRSGSGSGSNGRASTSLGEGREAGAEAEAEAEHVAIKQAKAGKAEAAGRRPEQAAGRFLFRKPRKHPERAAKKRQAAARIETGRREAGEGLFRRLRL